MREYASVFALGLLALIASVQSIAGEASISNIVIMLKRDVGLDSPIPLEASYLQRLSLKSGLDLTWQANTRTNGQILSLPMGVSPEQAKQATKILAKEPGVLWAHSGDLVDSVTSLNISKSTHDDVVSIAEFIIKFHGDDLNREISPLLLDKLALAAGRPVSIAGRTAQARIVALGTTINKDRADELQRVFESLPEVIYADPNGTAYTDGYSPMITPNDPLFWRGWQLQSSMPVNTPEPNGYPGAANVQAAWALSKGRSNQGVAVIDTGILFDHPDLKRALGRQRQKRGWDMITAMSQSLDGNMRDPIAQDEGDWVDESAACYKGAFKQSSWHGSHVAGIIAATTNNGKGVSGINWNTRIVPIRALGTCGGNDADIADSILWASGSKSVPNTRANSVRVQVINMSLGGKGACSSTYQSAIDEALLKGISVVVAAGNSSDNYMNYTPANCNGVVVVSSVNPLGDLAYYSNYGPGITVAAPGGQRGWKVERLNGDIGSTVIDHWGIWSTVNLSDTRPNNNKYMMGYKSEQGTSQAAPVVSGVISLMQSLDRRHRLNPQIITEILGETATPFPEYSSPGLKEEVDDGILVTRWVPSVSRCRSDLQGMCGPGIVNAEAAIKAVLDLQ